MKKYLYFPLLSCLLVTLPLCAHAGRRRAWRAKGESGMAFQLVGVGAFTRPTARSQVSLGVLVSPTALIAGRLVPGAQLGLSYDLYTGRVWHVGVGLWTVLSTIGLVLAPQLENTWKVGRRNSLAFTIGPGIVPVADGWYGGLIWGLRLEIPLD